MQTPIDDETLVAYLDGELPLAQREHIERHLDDNPALRQRVSALKASWDLLDDLPTTMPRADLAQSTIEIVTLAIEKDAGSWRGWCLQYRWLAWLVAAMTACLAGVMIVRIFEIVQTHRRLENLPAIVDYPSLQYIDSMEFLKALAEIDSLSAAAGNNGKRAVIGDGRVPLELAQRQSWVENLADDSRGRLQNHLNRFEALPADKQDQLNGLATQILSDSENAARYLETIRAYRVFLDAWGEKPKLDLARRPPQQRIADIQKQVALTLVLNHQPPPEDRILFREWINSIIDKEENMENFFVYSPTQVINDLLYGQPEESLVTRDDLDDLLNRLTPTSRQLLSSISDETMRRFSLGWWMDSPSSSERPGANQDLLESFSKLPDQKQDELEYLPESEVRRRLKRPTDVNPVAVPNQ